MNFSDLIGQKVFIQTSMQELEEDMLGGSGATVEVTGVESGGIWVVHNGLTGQLGKRSQMGALTRPQTGIKIYVFLPFSSIRFALYRGPDLNEESLGVE